MMMRLNTIHPLLLLVVFGVAHYVGGDATRAMRKSGLLLGAQRREERSLSSSGSSGFFFDYTHHGQDWTDGQCNSRERQSPIDFDKFAPWKCILGNIPPFKCDNGFFHYKYELMSQKFTLQNNGYGISADFAGQGFGGITYNNGWFNLLSVNFHSFSEHTFHKKHFPLEIHIVHKKYDSGHVLIVAIPVEFPGGAAAGSSSLLEKQKGKSFRGQNSQNPKEEDELDETLQVPTYEQEEEEIVSALHQQEAEKKEELRRKRGPPSPGDPGFNPTLQLYLMEPLPGKGVKQEDRLIAGAQDLVTPFYTGGTFFEYKGSLTAPPCAEQVSWLVRREPLKASKEQVTLLEEQIYKSNRDYGNYRDTMPLAGRPIYVRRGLNDEPAAIGEGAPFWDANVTRASDFKPVATAKTAVEEARHVARTAQAVDDAAIAASTAHANTMSEDEQVAVKKQPPTLAPPPPQPPADVLIKRISSAVEHKAREAAWNAASAALAAQSLNLGGAPGPAPAPGPAMGPAGAPGIGPAGPPAR